MKISYYDLLGDQQRHMVVAELTTDHPASSYGQSRGRNQQRLANIARWRQDEGQVVDLREGELIAYQNHLGFG